MGIWAYQNHRKQKLGPKVYHTHQTNKWCNTHIKGGKPDTDLWRLIYISPDLWYLHLGINKWSTTFRSDPRTTAGDGPIFLTWFTGIDIRWDDFIWTTLEPCLPWRDFVLKNSFCMGSLISYLTTSNGSHWICMRILLRPLGKLLWIL